MGAKTGIAWTDHTFNPWWGCEAVSPGCANCYAARDAGRFGFDCFGAGKAPRTFGDAHWREPEKWNAAARKYPAAGRRVFCGSMCDVFQSGAHLDPLRARLFALVERTRNLVWLILTKRPENVRAMVPWSPGAWPDNVWLGFTAENQVCLDERAPHALSAGCSRVFVSHEPGLGPLDLSAYVGGAYVSLPGDHVEPGYNAGLRWIITGGESGPHARPYDLAWARDIVRQCREAHTACFVKQMGAQPVETTPESTLPTGMRVLAGTHRWAFRDRAGADPSEWPEDLRVREFPEAAP